jgi:hypothetical protein
MARIFSEKGVGPSRVKMTKSIIAPVRLGPSVRFVFRSVNIQSPENKVVFAVCDEPDGAIGFAKQKNHCA